MNEAQPVIVVVFGNPRGLRLAATLSSLNALNEERGVIVDYQLEPSIQGRVLQQLEGCFDEAAYFNPQAFRRLCEALPKDMPVYAEMKAQLNKPRYHHKKRW